MMAEWTKGPILSLDIGSALGWCSGKPGCVKPLFGTVRLGSEGATPEDKGVAFCRWFDDIVAVEQPYAVCVESSMDPAVMLRVGNGSKGLRLALGLNYLACTYAQMKDITLIRQVNVDDHRRHFLGRARFKGGSDEAKRSCVARCHQLGWKVPDNNAADACAIWDYACAVWAPRTSAQQAIDRMAAGVRF